MSVSITELVWQAKPRGQTIQNVFVVVGVTVFSIAFLWVTRFMRHLVAVPMASTRCQQSLEIG
jgi:hypothetical protein